jgi:hypothetical protein
VSRTTLLWLVAGGSLLAGLGRFAVRGHDLSPAGSYEAFAHIWVGFLMGLGLLPSGVRREAWVALGVISALELVMFLLR